MSDLFFACFLMEFSSKGPKYTMQLASVCLDLILSFKICCQGYIKLQVPLFFPVIFLVVLNLFHPILKLILASRPLNIGKFYIFIAFLGSVKLKLQDSPKQQAKNIQKRLK